MGMAPIWQNGNTGGRNLSSISGEINTTTPTVNRGSDFTVSKTGTGDVTITLTQAFGGGVDSLNVTPIAAAGAGAGTAIAYKIITGTLTGAGFRVQFQNDAGTAVEAVFAFSIIGAYDPF